MLDFDLTEEQRLLEQAVREWGAREIAPRIRELDRQHRFDPAILPQMAELGLLGCSVPQDAYTASKGAVLSLTRSLAVQFGPQGVRSNAICPGPIETPLLMDWLVKDEAAKELHFELAARLRDEIAELRKELRGMAAANVG